MQDKKPDVSISENSNLVTVTTPEYVKESIKEAIAEHAASRNHPYATQVEPGFVTLSNDVNSDNEMTVATSKAVKEVYDLATANQNAINSHMSDSSLPVGVPVPWPTENPPEGWLICNGESFDKARYPKLALAYPSGVLPDLRGEFIRGLDNGRGVDSNRDVLSWQEGSYVVQEINKPPNNVVNFSLNERSSLNWDIPKEDIQLNGRAAFANKAPDGTDIGTWIVDKRYVGVTRPRNVAFNYIVRAA